MKNKNNNQSGVIPQFHLYGESHHNSQHDVEFIHIEDIVTRSEKNEWLIKPHRHSQLFQVLCIYQGKAEIKLDEQLYHIEGNWVAVIPAGTVHGFHFSSDTEGVVLTFAEHILNAELGLKEQGVFEDLLQSPTLVNFTGNTDLFEQLKQYIEQIYQEFEMTQKHYHLTSEWLVKIVLMTINRQLSFSVTNTETKNNNNQLLTRFKELLEQHFTEQWSVQAYADQLNTSTSSLNRLCNEVTGNSTKHIIQQRLMLEIKRRIIYTQEPLEQIAYRLGFKDVGYFSRFFKQHQGIPPKKYRQQKS